MPAQFEHRGITIEVTGLGQFSASFAESWLQDETLSGIKAKIDREISKGPKPSISLPVCFIEAPKIGYSTQNVISGSGILTGLNRTTSKPQITGSQAEYGAQYILPDTPDHRLLLDEYLAATKEADRLRKRVERRQIRFESYGRIDIDDYPVVLDKIKTLYNKILQAEEETGAKK